MACVRTRVMEPAAWAVRHNLRTASFTSAPQQDRLLNVLRFMLHEVFGLRPCRSSRHWQDDDRFKPPGSSKPCSQCRHPQLHGRSRPVEQLQARRLLTCSSSRVSTAYSCTTRTSSSDHHDLKKDRLQMVVCGEHQSTLPQRLTLRLARRRPWRTL